MPPPKTLACLLLVSTVLVSAPLPRPAPAFAMNMADGTKTSLRTYRGKVVLLAFIKTTCSHCQAVTGTFEQLQTELGARGFQVIEAAVEDEAKDHLTDFETKFKLNFPVGWSDGPDAFPVLRPDPKKLVMMPQCVLVDRKGIIRAQFSGEDSLFEGDPHQEANCIDREVSVSYCAAGGLPSGAACEAGP